MGSGGLAKECVLLLLLLLLLLLTAPEDREGSTVLNHSGREGTLVVLMIEPLCLQGVGLKLPRTVMMHLMVRMEPLLLVVLLRLPLGDRVGVV